MKVKEISRTANVAWSPSALQSIYLACGTVAQQLDATFSTSAKLEIFSLNLASPGLEMPLLGAVESPQRFHKLVWSSHGIPREHPSGLIIGGSDNGTISIWSAEKVLRSASDALVHQINQHVGAVRTLDVNPFQPNLLASGASESEIFIWDLSNPTTAMSPGNKIHPLEDVSGVAWNRQVQHILASTSPSGRSVVWDLRKNEPIIQVTDSSAHVHCNAIAWHPDVATQMVTASGDDRSPVIQMWDLRYATAPMRILERHKRGVLSLAWCSQDADLLLSAAKDNHVFCWNPNNDVPGGEVVYELPATSQWIFECHWCPRNPAIISTASFDGHVSMYSILGGERGGDKQAAEEKVATPATDDIFASLAARPQQRPRETAPLKTPPKWLRRPCGAQFGFGGKLVSFGNTRGTAPKTVFVSQVVTEHELLQRSNTLEESLSRQQFVEFCERKVQENSSTLDRNVWSFLKVTFEPEPRREYLKLLGYDPEVLAKKFSTWSQLSGSSFPSSGGIDVDELSEKLATIHVKEEGVGGGEREEGRESDTSSTAAVFGSEGEGHASAFDNLSLTASTDGSAQHSKKVSTAFAGTSVLPPVLSSFPIPMENDADGMISQALLVGNFEAAVDICIGADRMAEAMVLAIAGGPDLLQRTQQVFFQKKQSKVSRLLSAVVNRNWTELARYGNLENWREILAALVTYAGPEDFAPLCDLLGDRLETEADGRYRDSASLCYICSGNVDSFVECWNATAETNNGNALVLHDFVEKVTLLRRAVERERRQFGPISSTVLTAKLRTYAGLLASQGSLATALTYLQQSGTSDSTAVLHDRLYQAQGCPTGPKPECPFPISDIQPLLPTPSQPAPQTGSTPAQPPSTAVAANLYTRQNPATYQQVTQPIQPQYGGFGAPPSEPSGIVNPFGVQQQPYATSTGQPFREVQQPPITMTTSIGQGIPPQTGFGAPQIQPTSTLPPSSQPMGMQPAIFNPAAAMNVTPVAPPSSQVSSIPPPPTGSSKDPTDTLASWNDPPPLLKSKKPTSTYVQPTPIMAPVMAPVQEPFPQQQAPPTAQGQPIHVPQQTQPSPIQKQPPSPAPVVQKLPIPQEHMPMVSAFDGMLERCKGAANTTALKRKVDDISKKLSILYDLLRESKLSPDVLQGLHYIAQDIQTMNYHAGLARHTQMVSSGNFSEISSFMPGVKTLLQLGLQLRALKRKVDDISKKLSILYDLLRESKLSPDVLQGLHYIAQDIQTMNYHAGLARHTQMVSSGNFSEISSFMPGVKTLLQLGLQLRV